MLPLDTTENSQSKIHSHYAKLVLADICLHLLFFFFHTLRRKDVDYLKLYFGIIYFNFNMLVL